MNADEVLGIAMRSGFRVASYKPADIQFTEVEPIYLRELLTFAAAVRAAALEEAAKLMESTEVELGRLGNNRLGYSHPDAIAPKVRASAIRALAAAAPPGETK